MESDATISFGALLIFTTPTLILATIACVVSSCARRDLAEQRRELAALRAAMYPPIQYLPPVPTAQPVPTAPMPY